MIDKLISEKLRSLSPTFLTWRYTDFEQGQKLYALFDGDLHIRALGVYKEDLMKYRNELGWSKDCKICLIKLKWYKLKNEKNNG